MRRRVIAILFLIGSAGCTQVRVNPLPKHPPVPLVCIERNPKVEVEEFPSILEAGFARHGIETTLVNEPAPAECKYLLTYTALRAWDLAPYLSHAELHLMQGNQQVASAEYHLVADGGYSLMKFQSVHTKMDPVIDQLLAEYPIGTTVAKPEPTAAAQ